MYPHKALLESNSVDVTTLPEEIRDIIARFDELELELEEAEDENDDREEVKLSKELKALSAEAAREIKEFLDDETEEELTPQQVKERVLTAFVKNNQLRVTKAELAAAGFPGTDRISLRYQEHVGPFRLVKKMGEVKLFIERT